jgi:hypothetical protein
MPAHFKLLTKASMVGLLTWSSLPDRLGGGVLFSQLHPPRPGHYALGSNGGGKMSGIEPSG